MSYNYNSPNQQTYFGNTVGNMQFQQQNIQPLFPQPQGNVYNINSTLEVANVPVGAGISVALCLQEGFMYIKTLQNGNPMFWAYKITPYDSDKTSPVESEKKDETPIITEQFEMYNKRFDTLEQKVSGIQQYLKKDKEGAWEV